MYFLRSEAVFEGFTITREDARDAYGELRLQTVGLLDGTVVFVVHTARGNADHVISAAISYPANQLRARVAQLFTACLESGMRRLNEAMPQSCSSLSSACPCIARPTAASTASSTWV